MAFEAVELCADALTEFGPQQPSADGADHRQDIGSIACSFAGYVVLPVLIGLEWLPR